MPRRNAPASWKIRTGGPARRSAKIRCKIRIKIRAATHLSARSIQFLAVLRRRCDSKANPIDKSEASPQLVKNFPFTNQRADSFSSSGVNLEAKV
jgi:hypothetical protein